MGPVRPSSPLCLPGRFRRRVDLLDGGTPGLETVLLFEGYQRVIIVDAADMGLPPGTWRRFTPDTAQIRSSEAALGGTLHTAGLAEALALARALNLLPDDADHLWHSTPGVGLGRGSNRAAHRGSAIIDCGDNRRSQPISHVSSGAAGGRSLRALLAKANSAAGSRRCAVAARRG